MTKGVLVLLMVVYHSLNYTSQYHLGFRYLSFLPLSFILITGFLLSSLYSARYGEPGLVRRLVVRGLRLIALFTALNVAAQFVRSPTYGQSVGVAAFFHHWVDVYIAGGNRIASFEVLLPIAYLLLIAPFLIAMAQRHPAFLPVASTLIVITCALLVNRGVALANFGLMTVGICGMLVGRWFPDPTALGRFVWVTLLVYAAYLPLGITRGWVFLVQLLGAHIGLALICAVSTRLGDRGWWRHRIIRIGQYSLVAYIVQIGILQVLSRFIGRPDPISIKAAILFTATLVLMTLIIECIQWLRKASSLLDRTYKAVFA